VRQLRAIVPLRIVSTILAAAAAPVAVVSGYLLLLTLRSRRREAPTCGEPRTRFQVIVPAHDEAAGIAHTVESLRGIDYPRDLYEVVVVADNCTDDTAARANAAGARVLERFDDKLRGKGYALAHAFDACIGEGKAEAVVVVDADTLVSSNLLRAFDARLQMGAKAVQADYAVRNPDEGWRTRLMAIAVGMFHVVRSTGRESLGVSCGLRGNGMCFSTELLEEVPHDAFSVVEDLEYGIRLGEHGHRVHYAGEAHVYGEMVASEKASRSQRARWEGGRLQMAKRHAIPLLKRAIEERDPVLADLAIDVLIPPLSVLVMATAVGAAASAALAVLTRRPNLALILFGASGVCLAAYAARGWQVSGTGGRGLATLCYAPVYMAWKATLGLRRTRKSPDEWVRTSRRGDSR
jgi:cellulose synthase/poly-beta-1,6-N-acetylglucosamine synthase-like glycosyltransferase